MVSKAQKSHNIKRAIEDAEIGTPVRESARNWGVPESTLRARLRGSQDMRNAKSAAQKLTQVEEQDLADWICDQERCGRGPSRPMIRDFAMQILRHAGRHEDLGLHWVDRFFTRHPEVRMKPTREVDAVRIRETSLEALDEHYSRLDNLIKAKSVGTSRLYNCDEHGFQEAETKTRKVAGSSSYSHSIVSKGDLTPWASVLECVSAAGARVTPCVVLTGKTLQGGWFPPSIPDYRYEANQSGWMNTTIFIKWFKEVFEPETRPEIASLWRILTLDGFAPHESAELMHAAWGSKVYLVYLPPHSSHLTQPLDVGCFKALKDAYHNRVRPYAQHTSTAPVYKRRFIQEYDEAAKAALTVSNIKGGFRGAGVWPTNGNRAKEAIVRWYASRPQLAAPSTPQRLQKVAQREVFTPHNQKDIQHQVEPLIKEFGALQRGYRHLLQKAGEALDHKSGTIAALEVENAYLKDKIESQRASKRRKVRKNPNEAFASIGSIKEAQEVSEKVPDPFARDDGPVLQDEVNWMHTLDADDFSESIQVVPK